MDTMDRITNYVRGLAKLRPRMTPSTAAAIVSFCCFVVACQQDTRQRYFGPSLTPSGGSLTTNGYRSYMDALETDVLAHCGRISWMFYCNFMDDTDENQNLFHYDCDDYTFDFKECTYLHGYPGTVCQLGFNYVMSGSGGELAGHAINIIEYHGGNYWGLSDNLEEFLDQDRPFSNAYETWYCLHDVSNHNARCQTGLTRTFVGANTLANRSFLSRSSTRCVKAWVAEQVRSLAIPSNNVATPTHRSTRPGNTAPAN